MLFTIDGGPVIFMGSLGATAVFVWYFILNHSVRKSITPLPDSWNNVNGVIAAVAALHCIFIIIGSKFYQYIWITMAALIGLLTMQHVNVLFFKTNG
jgi:hypothetical protein